MTPRCPMPRGVETPRVLWTRESRLTGVLCTWESRLPRVLCTGESQKLIHRQTKMVICTEKSRHPGVLCTGELWLPGVLCTRKSRLANKIYPDCQQLPMLPTVCKNFRLIASKLRPSRSKCGRILPHFWSVRPSFWCYQSEIVTDCR